jgi:hypothetical protein
VPGDVLGRLADVDDLGAVGADGVELVDVDLGHRWHSSVVGVSGLSLDTQRGI